MTVESTEKKVSKLVPQQVPEFVHEYGPDFVKFLQAYYEWMEQRGQPLYLRHNMLDQFDIDKTMDEFVDYFHDHFMTAIPRNVIVDRRLLLKHIKQQLYLAKGSERSYEFLFRILYNETVEFYYPGDDILRLSDGKWIIEKSIKPSVVFVSDSALDNYVGKVITGQRSGAKALIERTFLQTVNAVKTYEFFLNMITSVGFEDGETVVVDDGTVLAQIDEFITYPGRWLNTDSFLSWDKYIQDNDYYQEFSYVLKVAQPINKFEKIVERLVHPAGTKMFVQFTTRSVVTTIAPTVDSTRMKLEIFPIVVSVTPTVYNALTYGDTDGILLTIDIPLYTTPVDAEFEGSRYNPVTGHVRVANSNIVSDYASYTLSDFSDWTIDDFTNGQGLIADDASFLTSLDPGDTFLFTDNASVVDDQLNTVETVSSDIAIRTINTMNQVANGSILLGTAI